MCKQWHFHTKVKEPSFQNSDETAKHLKESILDADLIDAVATFLD